MRILRAILNLFIAKPYESKLIKSILSFIRPLVSRIFYLDLIIHTENFRGQTWMGRTSWQPPQDLWTIQETITELRPSLVIETGTHKGGAAFFYATLFDLIEHDGHIITVDVEDMIDVDASHPKITFLLGDSTSDEIIDQIEQRVSETDGPIMVILDSLHLEYHVTNELERYHKFVTPGSFLLVQDGVTDYWGRPGPLAAINKFLPKHKEFQIDEYRCNRYIVTHHPKGWLKRLEN